MPERPREPRTTRLTLAAWTPPRRTRSSARRGPSRARTTPFSRSHRERRLQRHTGAVPTSEGVELTRDGTVRILTTNAAPTVAHVDRREPGILDRDGVEAWLEAFAGPGQRDHRRNCAIESVRNQHDRDQAFDGQSGDHIRTDWLVSRIGRGTNHREADNTGTGIRLGTNRSTRPTNKGTSGRAPSTWARADPDNHHLPVCRVCATARRGRCETGAHDPRTIRAAT